MNIYGKAMADTRRQAHSKVVELVLKPNKTENAADQNNPVADIGS